MGGTDIQRDGWFFEGGGEFGFREEQSFCFYVGGGCPIMGSANGTGDGAPGCRGGTGGGDIPIGGGTALWGSSGGGIPIAGGGGIPGGGNGGIPGGSAGGMPCGGGGGGSNASVRDRFGSGSCGPAV